MFCVDSKSAYRRTHKTACGVFANTHMDTISLARCRWTTHVLQSPSHQTPCVCVCVCRCERPWSISSSRRTQTHYAPHLPPLQHHTCWLRAKQCHAGACTNQHTCPPCAQSAAQNRVIIRGKGGSRNHTEHVILRLVTSAQATAKSPMKPNDQPWWECIYENKNKTKLVITICKLWARAGRPHHMDDDDDPSRRRYVLDERVSYVCALWTQVIITLSCGIHKMLFTCECLFCLCNIIVWLCVCVSCLTRFRLEQANPRSWCDVDVYRSWRSQRHCLACKTINTECLFRRYYIVRITWTWLMCVCCYAECIRSGFGKHGLRHDCVGLLGEPTVEKHDIIYYTLYSSITLTGWVHIMGVGYLVCGA